MRLDETAWQGSIGKKWRNSASCERFALAGNSGCRGYESEFALFLKDIIGLVEARAATGGLAQGSVAGFRIARNVTRRTAQFVFADRITDANVHSKTPAIDSQEHI